MDYYKFINGISALYENWGNLDLRPKTDKFDRLLENFTQKASANLMQLLNFAVSCMENQEIYCEVGCFQHETVIGALLDNPYCEAYAINNDWESERMVEYRQNLLKHISAFKLEDKVHLQDRDFEELFVGLQRANFDKKIGTYFYNGKSDYRSQILGFNLIKPFLAQRSLIVINNSFYPEVQQANWDFIAANPECKLLLQLPVNRWEDKQYCSSINICSWDADRNFNYDWTTIKNCHRQNVIDSITELNYLKISQYRRALETACKYLIEGLPDLNLEYYIGCIWEEVKKYERASNLYRLAINSKPDFLPAYHKLCNILGQQGQLEQAESLYRKALERGLNSYECYFRLGNILLNLNKIDEAISSYRIALTDKARPEVFYYLSVALKIKGEIALSLMHLGDFYYLQNYTNEAINYYCESIELGVNTETVYLNLGKCYESIKQFSQAINIYLQGIKLYPSVIDMYIYALLALQKSGQPERAIIIAESSCKLFPENLIPQFENQRILPSIYQTPDEIEFYRSRFEIELEKLIQIINNSDLNSPDRQAEAIDSLSRKTNFYLQYQGKNDLDLQIKYGELIYKVVSECYTYSYQPPAQIYKQNNAKIKIGYVSERFKNNVVGKLAIGWVKNHSNKFEVYCYYVGNWQDIITDEFRKYSHSFHQLDCGESLSEIRNNVEEAIVQITKDKPDILVFVDIGMHPIISQLASLRLAPIQCATWLHPVTSGLATVDYFISNQLMEPENAQTHYSEKLIKLANIGIYLEPPVIPKMSGKRSDYEIEDSAVVYACFQTLCKYLPQHDCIFARIAQQVPQARFIFIARPNADIACRFEQRMQKNLSLYNLNASQYCKILPEQSYTDYLNLYMLSDVCLDSFCWSGGQTTLDAIACNLPIVTLPGELMRGRQSYGILKRIGVTETIASSVDTYIDIAVKLGVDRQWRENIVRQIQEQKHILYRDRDSVLDLEKFYTSLITKQ